MARRGAFRRGLSRLVRRLALAGACECARRLRGSAPRPAAAHGATARVRRAPRRHSWTDAVSSTARLAERTDPLNPEHSSESDPLACCDGVRLLPGGSGDDQWLGDAVRDRSDLGRRNVGDRLDAVAHPGRVGDVYRLPLPDKSLVMAHGWKVVAGGMMGGFIVAGLAFVAQGRTDADLHALFRRHRRLVGAHRRLRSSGNRGKAARAPPDRRRGDRRRRPRCYARSKVASAARARSSPAQAPACKLGGDFLYALLRR